MVCSDGVLERCVEEGGGALRVVDSGDDDEVSEFGVVRVEEVVVSKGWAEVVTVPAAGWVRVKGGEEVRCFRR